MPQMMRPERWARLRPRKASVALLSRAGFILLGRWRHDLLTAFQDHFGSRMEAELEAARQGGQSGGRFNGPRRTQ